ncbi:MAG: glycosyltransferase family 2 protein [Cyclobacteriaceae bacterium]
MQKSISVVIPNYNGRKLLEQNLPTVFAALQKTQVEYEVIISDDASTDDSLTITDIFFDVILIANKINRGFSPTINEGIKAARMELVLLLNTDVLLSANYFDTLFQYFDKEDTFGVCGRFIGLNDDKIQDAAKYPELLSSKKIQPYNFYIDKPTHWVPTLFVSGGGALVNRRKLLRLSGFDEIYAPFYMEDTDLSIRAWEAGWRCYYEHEAICRHPASTTINKFHKKRSVWVTTQRNKLILHSLHLSKKSKLIWNFRQAVTLLVQALAFRWKYHQAFFKYLRKRDEVRKSKQRQLEVCKGRALSIEKIMESLREEISKMEVVKL